MGLKVEGFIVKKECRESFLRAYSLNNHPPAFTLTAMARFIIPKFMVNK